MEFSDLETVLPRSAGRDGGWLRWFEPRAFGTQCDVLCFARFHRGNRSRVSRRPVVPDFLSVRPHLGLPPRGNGVRTFVVAPIIAVLMGCSSGAPQPTAIPSAFLTIENRGGPDVVVTFGGTKVGELHCGSELTFSPTDPSLPKMPWVVQVATPTGDVLRTTTLDAAHLPYWIAVIGNGAVEGAAPIEGPPGPSCPGST